MSANVLDEHLKLVNQLKSQLDALGIPIRLEKAVKLDAEIQAFLLERFGKDSEELKNYQKLANPTNCISIGVDFPLSTTRGNHAVKIFLSRLP